jgi:branched-subunit amino acid transport protein
VLSAIIVPAVLFLGDDKTFAPPPGNERAVAAAVAACVAWAGRRRLAAGRQVWLTIAAGMATLWTLQALT